MIYVLLLLAFSNMAHNHLIIGRDLSKLKAARTSSGGDFVLTKPLSLRQKRVVVKELLKTALVQMVALKRRKKKERRRKWYVVSRFLQSI